MSETRPPVLEARAVSKSYGPGVRVLADVSLMVPIGSLVVVTGPSGSGKSTLLALLGGADAADPGVGPLRRPGSERPLRRGPGTHPPAIRFCAARLCVDSGPVGLGERELPARPSGSSPGRPAESRGRGPRPARPGRPADCSRASAERRRTTARGDCAGLGRAARSGAGRRADVEPGRVISSHRDQSSCRGSTGRAYGGRVLPRPAAVGAGHSCI